MKVLGVLSKDRIRPRRLKVLMERLDLGPSAELTLVMLGVPPRELRGVTVYSAEPSVVPRRPMVPVSGRTGAWGGVPKQATRVMRLGRRVLSAVPVPERLRVSDQRKLVIALQSPSFAKLAAQADVIVSLDAQAALATWTFAQTTSSPPVVHGPSRVREVLTTLGVDLPPARTEEEKIVTQVAEEFEDLPVAPPLPADLPGTRHRLLIAPANYAGQAHAWAEAVTAHHEDVAAMNFRSGPEGTHFANHLDVDQVTFGSNLAWRTSWRAFVERTFTHVIIEANRPILGSTAGDGRWHEAELRRRGIKVALLSHGSDARVPSVHAANERWHSYAALEPKALEALEQRSSINLAHYNQFDGTVFVSTPGLLAFVEKGTWLPLVVDVDLWAGAKPLLSGARPVVAHIPSSTQKGSHMIDPVLSSMEQRGLIEYLRVEGVPHEEMPAMYGRADIMVEQFGIADYSAAACEAMAGGRVVVSRVADAVREHVRSATGRELPIVEANPETLEQVILDLLADPERMAQISARSREFVREVHDGRRSAEVLHRWLES